MADRKGFRRAGLVTVAPCKHVLRFEGTTPVVGDRVYCRMCSDYRNVVASEFQVKLNCRNCRYGRSFGVGTASEVTVQDAERSAARHVMRNPGHTVEVRDSNDGLKVISHDANQGELPLAAQVRDRIEGNRPHQASLRDLQASLGLHGKRNPRGLQGP